MRFYRTSSVCRRGSYGAAAFLLSVTCTLMSLYHPQASARFDPLYSVKTRINEPNMLLVVDTSFSMSYPTFDENTTYFGDCYDGKLCITNKDFWGGANCSLSGKTCVNDNDCKSGSCSIDGAQCNTDVDCLSVGRCDNNNTKLCSADAHCSGGGRCQFTGNTCIAPTPNDICISADVDNDPYKHIGMCRTSGVSCVRNAVTVLAPTHAAQPATGWAFSKRSPVSSSPQPQGCQLRHHAVLPE